MFEQTFDSLQKEGVIEGGGKLDIVRIDMHEERERRGLEAIERFGALFVVVGLFELVCLEEKLEEMKRLHFTEGDAWERVRKEWREMIE